MSWGSPVYDFVEEELEEVGEEWDMMKGLYPLEGIGGAPGLLSFLSVRLGTSGRFLEDLRVLVGLRERSEDFLILGASICSSRLTVLVGI